MNFDALLSVVASSLEKKVMGEQKKLSGNIQRNLRSSDDEKIRQMYRTRHNNPNKEVVSLIEEEAHRRGIY